MEKTRSVTVLIPTFRRPESLTRALMSVFAQTRTALIWEIAVVDNDPDRSAHAAVEALRASSPAPLLYLHAQPAGVATARNVGLAATDAPYVAFLDDDETAEPNWLGELFDAHRLLDADVTFGPVQGRAPGAPAWKRPYLERFFSRRGPQASCRIDTVYGCGNTLMTRASALKGPAPFDEAANNTGGEDDRLFSQLRLEGARFAWSADARVNEHAPEGRATLAYTLMRAVAYGQSPSQLALRRGDIAGLVKWMAVGAGQAAVYASAALALLLILDRRWIDMADRAARGLGKMLWFMNFYFYGQGAAKRASPGGSSERGAASFTAKTVNISQMKSL